MKPYKTHHNDEGFERFFGSGSPETFVCVYCGQQLKPCDGVNHWSHWQECPKCKDQPLEGWWHAGCLEKPHDDD